MRYQFTMSVSSANHERTPLLQSERDLVKTGGTDVYGTETAIDGEIERSRPSTPSSEVQTSNPGVTPSLVVLALTIGKLMGFVFLAN